MKLRMPFCVAVALILSGAVAADSCNSPSPAKRSDSLHEVQLSRALRPAELGQLERFLNRLLKRDLDGDSEGFFCKPGLGEVEDNYQLAYRVQQLAPDQYDIRVQLQADKRGSNEERIRYTLGADKLYLGPNTRGNEVVILKLARDELKLLEKYRRPRPGGAPMVRETVRHYRLMGEQLSVDNLYYSNGLLISANHWQLD